MEIIGNKPGRPRERTARTPCWLSGHKKGGAVCSSTVPQRLPQQLRAFFISIYFSFPMGIWIPFRRVAW